VASAQHVGIAAQRKLLLEWAFANVPYYREAVGYAEAVARLRRAPFDDDAWASVPVLTKEQVREANARLHARDLPAGHGPMSATYSSGSTGVRVEVKTTALSRAMGFALTVREHLWRKRDFGKRLGVTRVRGDADRRSDGDDQPSWGPPVSELFTTGPGSVIHVGRPITEVAAWLTRFDPHYLLTYPSVVAELLDRLDRPPPALEEIRMMSEPLDRELEERIAAQWGVRCTDLYSAGELGYVAFRCAEHGRLHVQSESVLVEILDESARPCGVGGTGRVVVTRLHNLATPLIRYDLGDYATVGAPCACGRTSPVLEAVRGRVRNMVRTPDGRTLWPAGMNRLGKIAPVLNSQCVQTALDRIEVRLVCERPLTDEERGQVTAIIRHGLEFDFNVDVVAVDRIERGPTGKYEQFLSLLPAAPVRR
jgi:phenylacetate-CoA ligase